MDTDAALEDGEHALQKRQLLVLGAEALYGIVEDLLDKDLFLVGGQVDLLDQGAAKQLTLPVLDSAPSVTKG